MRICAYLVTASLLVLAACATPPLSVSLSPVASAARPNDAQIGWQDRRSEPVVALRMNQGGAEEVVRQMTLSSPLAETFIAHLRAAAVERQVVLPSFDVALTDMQLRDRVGFLTADKLNCNISSEVVVRSSDVATAPKAVKTYVDGVTSKSPSMATAGQKILDACLQRHAVEIIAALTEQSSMR